MTKPIWLLDVDGVLNAVQFPVATGFQSVRVDGFKINWRPEVPSAIRRLVDQDMVEVRWLTTWCERAELIAEALDLPRSCAVEGLENYKGNSYDWWKSAAAKVVSDANPDRPLIWTDDDLGHATEVGEVEWLQDRTAEYLAISPGVHWGLSDEQLQQIVQFCERYR